MSLFFNCTSSASYHSSSYKLHFRWWSYCLRRTTVSQIHASIKKRHYSYTRWTRDSSSRCKRQFKDMGPNIMRNDGPGNWLFSNRRIEKPDHIAGGCRNDRYIMLYYVVILLLQFLMTRNYAGTLDETAVRNLSPNLICATQRLVNRIVRRAAAPDYGYVTVGKLTLRQKKSLIFKLMAASTNWFGVREAIGNKWRDSVLLCTVHAVIRVAFRTNSVLKHFV